MTSVPLARRAGGLDLARGAALLGIALANTVGWLYGEQWTVLVKQADTTALDRSIDVLLALLVDNRGFPLFALLFGYGIGILHRASLRRGESSRRFLATQARRHVVLLAIGLLHGIFLFTGDILAGYAIIGMLCSWLATRGRLPLMIMAGLAFPMLATWGWADGVVGLGTGDGYASAQAGDYASSLQIRTGEVLRAAVMTPILDIGLLSPMALGALGARYRLLEDVRLHADLLGPLTRWGLGIGLVGAIPLTVVLVADPHHEVLRSEPVLGALGVVHQLTGVIGAVGAAALAALLAQRFHGRFLRAVQSLGATALTAYLAQSALFLALLPAFTLGLGDQFGTTGAGAIAVGGWLLMLPLAAALRGRGRRGPFEWLLRYLAGATRAASSGRPGTGRSPAPPAAWGPPARRRPRRDRGAR